MATIQLEDDCHAEPGIRIRLEGDCGPEPPGVDVRPTLRLLLRTKLGYTDDGAAVFGWNQIIEDASFLWTAREEVDAEAGITYIRAKATMPNTASLTEVPETAVVLLEDAVLFRIINSATYPDRIELGMERTAHHGGTGADVTVPSPEIGTTAGGDAIQFGSGSPTIAAPYDGADYVNLDTGQVYTVEAGAWTLKGDLFPVLVLGPVEPIPPGTPPGTIIVRTT